MEVVLVRMSRFFNTENNTVFFDGKFAGADLFKSLGPYFLCSSRSQIGIIKRAVYPRFLSPAVCGDLITAVFDFAHDMCALKLSEHQLALFSAVVLINTGEAVPETRCNL